VQARQTPPVYPCLSRRCDDLKQGEKRILNLGNDLGAASLSGAVFDSDVPVASVVIKLRPLFAWDYTCWLLIPTKREFT